MESGSLIIIDLNGIRDTGMYMTTNLEDVNIVLLLMSSTVRGSKVVILRRFLIRWTLALFKGPFVEMDFSAGRKKVLTFRACVNPLCCFFCSSILVSYILYLDKWHYSLEEEYSASTTLNRRGGGCRGAFFVMSSG